MARPLLILISRSHWLSSGIVTARCSLTKRRNDHFSNSLHQDWWNVDVKTTPRSYLPNSPRSARWSGGYSAIPIRAVKNFMYSPITSPSLLFHVHMLTYRPPTLLLAFSVPAILAANVQNPNLQLPADAAVHKAAVTKIFTDSFSAYQCISSSCFPLSVSNHEFLPQKVRFRAWRLISLESELVHSFLGKQGLPIKLR